MKRKDKDGVFELFFKNEEVDMKCNFFFKVFLLSFVFWGSEVATDKKTSVNIQSKRIIFSGHTFYNCTPHKVKFYAIYHEGPSLCFYLNPWSHRTFDSSDLGAIMSIGAYIWAPDIGCTHGLSYQYKTTWAEDTRVRTWGVVGPITYALPKTGIGSGWEIVRFANG